MAYQAAQLLDALGDPTRRAIFESLAEGPLAVVDIARDLPISRPAVSQHLKVLKEAGLLLDRAEGTRRLYAIDRAGVAALRRYFDGFWDDALDAFRRAAEGPPETPRRHRTRKGKSRKEKKS